MKIGKKLLSMLLTAALVVSLMPGLTLPAQAASYTYHIDYGSITISQNTSDNSKLDVTYFESSGAASSSTQTIDASDEIVITQTDSGTSTLNTITFNGDIGNITLSGVNIDVSSKSGYCAFSAASTADVYLTLTGTNILKSGKYCAGLSVGGALTITESSTGSLDARGGDYGAGIGGGASYSVTDFAGSVEINGGTVIASGGRFGAGIGGGGPYNSSISAASASYVTINGGVVIAIGNDYAAGIGGGGTIGSNVGGDGGTVTITGGTVYASGAETFGIGCGTSFFGSDGDNGTCVITGGSVRCLGMGPTPTNGTKNVYLTTVTLENVAAEPVISNLTTSPDLSYGIDDVSTDTDGKLYLWLPVGTETTAAQTTDGAASPTLTTYTGSITTLSGYTASGTLYQTYTYTATVDPTSKTFTAATVGYGDQTAQEFTITNTGTGDLTNLSAVLSGTNFEISTALSGDGVASGSTATISVRPKTGLSEGTYTDTLTITGDNSISLTVNLSFTVSTENPSTYTITASAGSGGSISPSGSVSVSSGGSQTFTITANSNYSISSVLVDSVSQGAISTYTFTDVSADHTISATFTYTGGSSGGSSSGSTKSSYSATMSGDGSGKLTVTVDEDSGSASAAVSGTQGKLISGGKSLVITMPGIDDVTDYILGIPVSGLSSDSGDGSLTLNTGAGSVTLPSNMLTETDTASGDAAQIKLGLVDSSELSDAAKAAVGDRPVVSLTLYIDGEQTDWSNSDAPVTVSIPYTPADGEDLNAIVVWYIDGDGNLNCVQNGHYDSETGTVTFQTTHFSLYAVGYNAVSFSDVSDSAWYADYVSFLAARGIIGGNNGAFSPDASITRAEFVTILARMSGDDLSGYTSSSFSDVTATDWYFGAVQWAYDSGVTTGYDGKFNPNAAITREQMAAMLYRYADYAGDISNTEGMFAREFSDYDSISSWAQAPIQWAVNNGIITGNPDGSFAPQENATRAEAAKMIAVLLQSIAGM